MPFPFQANLAALTDEIVRECICGLNATHRQRRDNANESLEDRVTARFGAGLARHFFIPYHTKLYGNAAKNMSAEWCDKFIPKPDVNEIIEGAYGRQKKDFGYNIDFYYPAQGGNQKLSDAFAEQVQNLWLGSGVKKIHWQQKQIETHKTPPIRYDHLVSTIPLPELLRALFPLPAEFNRARKRLRWRSVHCINLGLKKEDLSNRHWAYFPEPEYVFYRVGFTHNFAPRSVPPNHSSLYIEIAGDPDEKINSEDLVDRAVNDLRRAGILGEEDEIAAMQYLPIPYAYVVYDHHRFSAVNTIQRFLTKNGIHSIGRYGGWKYSFMEEAILDGKQMAERLLRERG